MVRVWFVFPEQRIKVPNSWELGPFAGDVHDNGNDVNTDSCVEGCKNASCGDGFTGPGEACDDGNEVDDDACSNECAAGSCGDAKVQPGEDCDDGNKIDTDACLSTCVAAACGDKVVQEDVEACDDGNDVNTDACVDCVAAKCGDKFVQAGTEECDDGNMVNTDACTNMCKSATCTDKLKNGTESDIDCGGDACDGCANGKACVDGDDCGSGLCKNKICSALTLTIGPCAAANVTSMQAYTAVIQPKCGCHVNGSGGLTMNSAATFKANTVNVDSLGASMKLITPNSIDASYLLYKVHGQQANVPNGGGSTMPLGGQPLSDAEKCTLINWVKSGAN